MVQLVDPSFEPRLGPDGLTWEIVVTWGHTLRDRIPDLVFGSCEQAITWIENRSTLWFSKEKRYCLEESAVRVEKFAKGALAECESKATLCEHKAFLASDDSLRDSHGTTVQRSLLTSHGRDRAHRRQTQDRTAPRSA
jgi:hypothetical protein